MAQRRTKCPECQSWRVETVKIHNPDTHDMNANATLRCLGCDHTWEGRVISPRQQELRRKGRRI